MANEWVPKKCTSDDEYVICPNCGNQQGDCWEWVKTYEQKETCSECGCVFIHFAEYSVTYYAQVKKDDVGTRQE